MAGCFGNSDYDRWLEHQVDEYCNIPEPPDCCNGPMDWDDGIERWVCPDCGRLLDPYEDPNEDYECD